MQLLFCCEVRRIEKKKFELYYITKFASIINRYGQIYYDRKHGENGIGGGQQFYLMAIERRPGLNQWELAELFSVDKGTVAKNINKLEDLGYVRRQTDEEDKRINHLFITDAGKEVTKITENGIIEWHHIITEGLSQEEIEQMIRCMEKVAENSVNFIKTSCKKSHS